MVRWTNSRLHKESCNAADARSEERIYPNQRSAIGALIIQISNRASIESKPAEPEYECSKRDVARTVRHHGLGHVIMLAVILHKLVESDYIPATLAHLVAYR